MTRKSIASIPPVKQPRSLPTRGIRLTPVLAEPTQQPVSVLIAELIAYSQNYYFTRLNLTGGKVLDVKETTDQIDRMVRAASGQTNAVEPVAESSPSA